MKNTPDIQLRAMEPEDLDALYRIENDVRLWGVSATNVPYSRYTLHDYIAHSTGDIYADRQVRLIIEDASTHTLMGIADLVNFDPRHGRAEVGIVIEQPYRRCGYAYTALQHLHCYAEQVLHLHQLYAIIASTNVQANALFARCGYRQAATLSDWLFDGHTYSDAVVMQLIL